MFVAEHEAFICCKLELVASLYGTLFVCSVNCIRLQVIVLFSVCSPIRYHYYYQHHKYGTLNRNWFFFSTSFICCSLRICFISLKCCTFYWSCSCFIANDTLWMLFLLWCFSLSIGVCVLYCSFTSVHAIFFLLAFANSCDWIRSHSAHNMKQQKINSFSSLISGSNCLLFEVRGASDLLTLFDTRDICCLRFDENIAFD